ncbi:BCL-6 corepressor-like protein 1 [Brienomyrus brachyistius]|uniref:BCL-6 corepressor-like protein 1 n=1 Tax=Brienomyrus brachyistius TaxID=42636 RepID=UPI0020B2A14D|nr:BCL-6 corepressor-like protein 1 [Brienomyrus brachyistius]XP_048885434.1 BCL-6 corepressor-like protein 1 [Brienomyrus brachyistius]XP_048885435.1 BCL-6 corepressor-like protein 1 [Brienomyrus brachyistius]XP_048885436.1 BCL-6 corepressor-like protein 1 [Brienomyrus brachyistius]
MQVDPTPASAADGDTVSFASGPPCAAPKSMVGNPPQTLSPDLRGDVPSGQQERPAAAADGKTSKGGPANPCPGVAPEPQNGGETLNAELHKRADVASTGTTKTAGPFPAQQRSCGKKGSQEVPLNAEHSKANPNKGTKSQAHPVISLPPGFHCSPIFKPGQPVAFLPTSNLGSSLCKITLPPGLGPIAALRDASANQFPVEPPPQSTSSSVTGQLTGTYGFHFSMGLAPSPTPAPTPESKPPPAAVKLNSSSTSGRSSKVAADRGSSLGLVASPAIGLPLQQPPLSWASLVPPVCSSPTLASVTLHSRLPDHTEKNQQRTADAAVYARLEPPSSVTEPKAVCPAEVRDVPLDLSSKSKRQNVDREPQRPLRGSERQHAGASLTEPVSQKKAPAAIFGSAPAYAIYPDALRNGVPTKQPAKLLNHQVLEPSASWPKLAPQGPIASIAGTYVGVASPILASTLRSKDGKCAAFVEDIQSIAKQESISIIDQGEQLASRGKKGTSVSKEAQHSSGSKLSNSVSSPGSQVCVSKDPFSATVSGSTSSHNSSKHAGGKAVIPKASAVDVTSRPQPGLLPHQRPSKQQKILQGSTKAQLGTSCHGTLIHGPRQSPSKADEKKWEPAKCPLSNLESIVKQKALETTGLAQDDGATLDMLGLRKPEVEKLHVGHQDAPFRQGSAGGFPPFRSVKWRDGSMERDSSAARRGDEGCDTERRGGIVDRQVGQEGNSEGNGFLDASRPPTRAASTMADGQKRVHSLAQEVDGGVGMGVKHPGESLSPCVKLEGIALSILKGQRSVMTELGRKTPASKGRARAIKEKQPSKNNVVSPGPIRQAEKGSPSRRQGRQAKRPRKSWAPGLEPCQAQPAPPPPPPPPPPSQQDREQQEELRGGRGGLPHTEEGNLSGQSAEMPSSTSPARDMGDSDSPRLRRGRRRGDQPRQADWRPPGPSPPIAPLAVRRPRGRPRSNPLPSPADLGGASPSPCAESDAPANKKRRRRRNRKYQNGEYIVEREQVGEAEAEEKSVNPSKGAKAGADPRPASYLRLGAASCCTPSQEPNPQRALLTRSGSVRHTEGCSAPESADKPSGKRKFKSKHLGDAEEDEKKLKGKRSGSGKRPPAGPDVDSPSAKRAAGPCATPKGPSSPLAGRKGVARKSGSAPEPASARPVPPEVRRLIVNKNAGETLLQRAARLGYQEVVLYCLEKDVREVNRRDNAGYTALHEACAHGWAAIVQLLLEHGADVNCSAQDGTRPIHDAVASDNLLVVWMLLNHGADPTLATYAGQTAVKLAQSPSMRAFLEEYFTDLEARNEEDISLPWDFYSSTVFETDQEACWEFLLSLPEEAKEEGTEMATEKDHFLFEFSAEPLLPCYHVQVSLSQGFCNWFLLSDVLKRLKMSARIFRARYPQFEVASVPHAELRRQVAVSQVTPVPRGLLRGEDEEEDTEGPVELVRCVPDLQGLLGSTVQILEEESSDTAGACRR